jgi:hypothetical protein
MTDLPADLPPEYYDSYGGLGQEPTGMNQGSAMMGQYDSKLILWMLDPTTIIDEIKNQLKGVVIVKKWDKESNSYVDVPKKVAEPLINNIGINNLIYLLNFHLGKHAGTTVLREDTIVEMTKQFGKDITLLLMEKWQNFGMDFSTITPIRNAIVRIVYMSLMRSKDGTFLDALTKTYRETYATANAPQGQQRQKFGTNFLGWGR